MGCHLLHKTPKCTLDSHGLVIFFFVVKGPAAAATDTLQL
jgi:hypothetical protein